MKMQLLVSMLQVELSRLDHFENGSSNRNELLNQMRAAISMTLESDEPEDFQEKVRLYEDMNDLVIEVRRRLEFLKNNPKFSGNSVELARILGKKK